MSEQECRNDCTRPLKFPRRPGHNVADGVSDCFCCSPNERVSIDNRPSLSHFNYRIGTYATIREWLIRKLDLTPSLQSWTHREPDDPGIALLEGAAILGDILTFYQELYANEAFLRTATWRESISDLVRLLGYRLSPGIGGNATFAFEVKGNQSIVVPANFPVKADLEGFEKPSDFETNEEITAYPWLSRFNLFCPMTTPQVGVTTTEFYISGTSTVEINKGDKLLIGDESTAASGMPTKLVNAEVVIVDSVRELHGIKLIKIKGALEKRTSAVGQIKAFKLGRMFHHFGHNGPKTLIRTPNPVESEATIVSTNPQKTSIKTNINEISIIFTRSLSSTTSSSSIGFSNYQSSHTQVSFSQNSSQSQSASQSQQQMMVQMGNSNSNIVSNIGSDLELEVNVNVPDIGYLYSERIVSPSLSNKEFPLDAEVPDLPSGIPFIVQITFGTNDEATVIRKIKNVRSDSVTWGQLTGTVSIVTLETSLSSSTGSHTTADIRKMVFHESIGEAFTLKARLIETSPLPVNKVLAFYGTSEQAQNLRDRRILFEKAGADVRVLTVMNVTTPAWDLPQMHYITLSDEVTYSDFPQENPTVTVYGNLVDATEGKTLPEVVLGSGDNTQVFQTFKLPKAPLTYHLSASNTPPETPELEIYVAGRRWQQVSTLFGHDKKDEIYIVREDAANNSWVQFGDGKTGLRLPTGIKNVSAVYRTGTGAFGALKPDTKAQASAKLKNLDKIQMPAVATGGAEPEDGENARFAAPGKVQSLDRLVSLRDFETETAAIPGVALASASWALQEDNIPSVVITALMETGRGGEFSAVQETINNYNRGRGPQRFPVLVDGGKRLYVNIAAQYAIDPNYREELVKPEIEKALGVNFGKATNKENQTGLFSLRRRRFGAREYASTIEGVIQNVQGVVWAKVTAFNFLSDADNPATIGVTSSFNPIVLCDELHVLSLYYKHLSLTLLQQGGI